MIYVLKTQNDYGSYVDEYGQRWEVQTARGVYGAIVEDWQQFPSLDDALIEWGLTEYVEPEPIDISTETE